MLGNSSNWQVACLVTSSSGETSSQEIGLDSLDICALDVVCESSGQPSTLERRVIDFVAASQPAGGTVAVMRDRSADGRLGFGELVALADRIRVLASQATTLGTQQLMGADASPTDGIDMNELASRINGMAGSLSAASTALASVSAALVSTEGTDAATISAAVDSGRTALIALAISGLLRPTRSPVRIQILLHLLRSPHRHQRYSRLLNRLLT
jgi:hypothetical protein